MSKKYNSAFFNAYIELDRICCHKFGIVSGGITEYINRLINARFAPDREQVLPKLVQYRNIRNRIAHEVGALKNIDELTKADVKWLEDFVNDIEKNRDPITQYLRKAKRYVKRRRTHKRIIKTLSILAIIATLVCLFVFRQNIEEWINMLTGTVS